MSPSPSVAKPGNERRRDLLAFLFLTVVLAPVLAVAIVGGFGFAVWIFQMFAGPPGSPGG
ncbi:MAG TPA: periplasmic nitrate reductase, NapE protein [Gammaproteobacteria bacterium]|jgi:nitrate reductase NapE